MRKTDALTVITLLLLILAVSCRQPEMEVTTNIEVPVGVIEVTTSSIEEYINTTGTVNAMKEETMIAEIAGKYRLQVNPATGKTYAVGDQVKAGDTIIKLEDEEYINGLRIRSKEVDYEISKQEYEKQKSLYEKGGATLRELKNAEIKLINTGYDIEAGMLNLAKMTIEAPFSGIISRLPYFTDGSRIPNGTELVKIINYRLLYLESNLPEKYFGNIAKGFRVYITSYTNPGDTLAGTITQISPEIDPETRTFQCFVEVKNDLLTLLPGMFVRADMVVNSAEKAIVIPKEIVTTFNRQQMVYVVDRGVAKARFITTGLENEKHVEVRTGLEKGESIVSKGFETLRNDSKVRIVR